MKLLDSDIGTRPEALFNMPAYVRILGLLDSVVNTESAIIAGAKGTFLGVLQRYAHLNHSRWQGISF